MLARAARAGGKGRAVPIDPNGKRDQGPTGDDELYHGIGAERAQHAGESDHPIETRWDHVLGYGSRTAGLEGRPTALAMERGILQGMQMAVSLKGDGAFCPVSYCCMGVDHCGARSHFDR